MTMIITTAIIQTKEIKLGNLTTAKAITFLDIETTHLDPSKSAILSISIITDWEDGKQDVWTTNIKPKDIELQFASDEALKICMYDEDKWADAPSFKEVAPEIAKRLMWGPLVAHNIQFDVGHIKAVFKRYGYRAAERNERVEPDNKLYKIGYPQIDTCALAYLFLPTERQNLDTLREYFGIKGDRAHSADTDTEDCRHVFYKILEFIDPS